MEEQKGKPQTMTVSLEETEAVARLARLDLSEDEKSEFSKKLSGIVENIKQLSRLDTENVGFGSSAGISRNDLRVDEAGAPLSGRDTFRNAPDEHDGHFRVPRIID